MSVSLRGFLLARFVAMVAWVALLAGSYLAYRQIAPHVASDFVRWLINMATLVGAIVIGIWAQQGVLRWLDPDGDLRRRVRDDAEAARRRS